jgi:ATP-dependent DNA ligase
MKKKIAQALWHDLRYLPLIDRKLRLRAAIPHKAKRILYSDHLHADSEKLFRLVCKNDLEGVVAKWKNGSYITSDSETSWVKVKNPKYTQIMGRDEVFEREQSNDLEPDWDGCLEACIAVAAH